MGVYPIFVLRINATFGYHVWLCTQATRSPGVKVPVRIVQRYIAKPLLVDGRKFDIRAYLLLASSNPMIGTGNIHLLLLK